MKTTRLFLLLTALLTAAGVQSNELQDLLALLDAPHGLHRLSTENSATLERIHSEPDKYIELLAQLYDATALDELATHAPAQDKHRFEVAVLLLSQLDSDPAFAQLTRWYRMLDDDNAVALRRTLLASIGTRPHVDLIQTVLEDLPEMDAGTFFAAYEYLWHAAESISSIKDKVKQLLQQGQVPEYQLPWLNRLAEDPVTH